MPRNDLRDHLSLQVLREPDRLGPFALLRYELLVWDVGELVTIGPLHRRARQPEKIGVGAERGSAHLRPQGLERWIRLIGKTDAAVRWPDPGGIGRADLRRQQIG